MQKGDIVRYAGKRYVADHRNSYGRWFFLPTLGDGVTPDRRRSVYCFHRPALLKISGKRKNFENVRVKKWGTGNIPSRGGRSPLVHNHRREGSMKITEKQARDLLIALKFNPKYVKAFDAKVLASKINAIPENGKVKRPTGEMGKLFDKVIGALEDEDEVVVVADKGKPAPAAPAKKGKAPAKKGKAPAKKGKAPVDDEEDEDEDDEESDEDDEEEDSEDDEDSDTDEDDDDSVEDDDEGDSDDGEDDEDEDESGDEDEDEDEDSEDDEDGEEDEDDGDSDDDEDDDEDVDADEDDGDDEEESEDDEDETTDDEDDEMEAPVKTKKAAKGKPAAKAALSKNGKKPTPFKSAAAPGKPGVIESIVEFLGKASESKPLSKTAICSMIKKRFPDRDEDAIKSTVNQNVPGKLQKKGHKIGKNEKGYWLKSKAK